MGNLIDSLVRLFEFIIQGVLAAVVIGFALAWVHPFKDAVSHHVKTITEYMLHPHWVKPIPDTAIAAILVGGVYFLGVLTNVVGYWLLEPAHNRIIHAATVIAENRNDVQDQADAAYWEIAFSPFRIDDGGKTKIQDLNYYRDYIKDEVLWRNRNLSAMQDALDPLFKQSRIIRGTVVCALTFSLIAIAKTIYFFFVWLLFIPEKSRRLNHIAKFLYATSVNPLPHEIRETQSEKADTKKFVLSGVAYVLLSSTIYLLAIAGWRAVEIEYHLMAKLGAASAVCPSPMSKSK